jgi:hypothetical protein
LCAPQRRRGALSGELEPVSRPAVAGGVRGEVRSVDWAKLFKDATAVRIELADAKAVLKHLAIVEAILEAHESWPEVAAEWKELSTAIRELAGDCF